MEAVNLAGHGGFGVILASKIWLEFVALTERQNIFGAYARLG